MTTLEPLPVEVADGAVSRALIEAVSGASRSSSPAAARPPQSSLTSTP